MKLKINIDFVAILNKTAMASICWQIIITKHHNFAQHKATYRRDVQYNIHYYICLISTMLSWLSPSVAALHIPHEDTTWGHHAAHGEKQIRAFTVVNGCDVSVTKDRINCSSFKMTGRKIPFCSWPTITRCLGWNSRV